MVLDHSYIGGGTYGHFLMILNRQLPQDPAIEHLGIKPEKWKLVFIKTKQNKKVIHDK